MSEEFIDEILSMKIHALSNRPIQFHNKYVLLYKKAEEGQSLKKLKHVSASIEAQIKVKKMAIKIKDLLNELNKKYKIEIDKTLI